MREMSPLEDPRHPVCLVLMPMLAGFEEIRASVARAINEAGLTMLRLEKEIEDSAWHLWLLDSTDAADVALVDLSGNNPFVMYELGYVHHRRLPTAFIVRVSDGRLPATVRGSACLPYGEDLGQFERDLALTLRDFRPSQTDIDWETGCLPRTVAELYRQANDAATDLEKTTRVKLSRVGESEFRSRLTIARRRGMPVPVAGAGTTAMRHLLSLFLADSDQVEVLGSINEWTRATPVPQTE